VTSRVFPTAFALFIWAQATQAASPNRDPCGRLPQGAEVPEPPDLRSVNGILEVDLSVHDFREPDGSVRYCYVLPDGRQSPALRLSPGDLLILRLTNSLTDVDKQTQSAHAGHSKKRAADPCTSGAMTPVSTNLHFHGLSVPPVCHQDDVLRTSVQPTDPPFEYRFQIPANQSPGLYWYHPHIHGFSSRQVLGGASGPLVIEGLERATPQIAGLPERIFVIRDQDLVNPNAPPSRSEPVVPRKLIDRDGDSANTGTGFGKPAKDLSINFVPVPYPDYPPAMIRMKPGERQLWRIVNAGSVTYLNLAVIFGRTAQKVGLVAIDGVPMNVPLGKSPPITWVDHIGVPPGARAEFIVEGPPA
jgi:FtsP/CotA-like multicopper oxidase with cupredoxin domain